MYVLYIYVLYVSLFINIYILYINYTAMRLCIYFVSIIKVLVGVCYCHIVYTRKRL